MQLVRLRALLEDYDGEAGDSVVALQSQLVNTGFAQPRRDIGERINDFEFEEALECLNALREAMNAPTIDSAAFT